MKQPVVAVGCMLLLMVLDTPLRSEKTPIFDVHQATIVAFFPPVTDAELSKDDGTNETLADFQYYAGKIQEPLKKAGIAFHEVYAHSFRIRNEGAETTFRPEKVHVGYYFVVPGKKPRIEYGVMTDVDLLQIANEYFGTKFK
jgi:hypothetical protein